VHHRPPTPDPNRPPAKSFCVGRQPCRVCGWQIVCLSLAFGFACYSRRPLDHDVLGQNTPANDSALRCLSAWIPRLVLFPGFRFARQSAVPLGRPFRSAAPSSLELRTLGLQSTSSGQRSPIGRSTRTSASTEGSRRAPMRPFMLVRILRTLRTRRAPSRRIGLLARPPRPRMSEAPVCGCAAVHPKSGLSPRDHPAEGYTEVRADKTSSVASSRILSSAFSSCCCCNCRVTVPRAEACACVQVPAFATRS
jgi:hypothetical protein